MAIDFLQRHGSLPPRLPMIFAFPLISNRVWRLRACFVASISILMLGQGALAQPSLTRIEPASLVPGKATVVTIHGGDLTAPLTLWSPVDLAAEDITPAADQNSATCRITVGSDLAVGVVAIVVANATGISDPLLLMIDDLTPVVDNGSNHSLAESQPLSTATVVHGRSDGVLADYYRLSLAAGQQVSVEVVAQRIASSMDPILRVLDHEGRELATADDEEGAGADCRLRYRCDLAGETIVEIRDSRHQAGGNYCLRIGDFPIITSPFPLGGRRGTTHRYQFTGVSAATTQPIIAHIPETTFSRRMAVSAKRAGGRGSSMAMIATSDLPEVLESEPNDEHDQGTMVTLPCAISGIFQNTRDSDCYEFAVSKAQRLDFTSYGRSLGTPAYAFLQLYDEQDKLLVESDVTDSDELTLTHTPAQDGMLRLVVRDLVNRGGARYAYRVEIRSGPDFSLTLQQEKETQLKFAVPANGGHIALNVQAQRRGYEGPIQLELEHPDTEFELYNATIPAGANEVTLHLATPAELTVGDFQVLRVSGRAEINGREIWRGMHTESTLRAKFPLMPYPPHRLDGLLSMVAIAAQEPFFATTSEQDTVTMMQGSEPCEYVFSLLRLHEEFKEAVTVFVEGLPAGVQAAVKPTGDKVQVSFTGKHAVLGEYPIRLVSVGQHQGRGQVDLQEVSFRVVAAETETGSEP